MDFASRISVTCFAASYAIGMLNEIARIFWPQRFIRWLATFAAVAGILAQTLYLGHLSLSMHRLPIASQFESLITVSWFIALIYLYLLLRDRRLAAGIFLLPISLGLVLFATFFSDRGYRPAGGERNPVLVVAHGVILLVGLVAVCFALVISLMYLVKGWQLRRGSMLGTVRLPSLERLDALNSVAVYVAWPLLTVGIVLGFLPRELSASDPKVIATVLAWALFTGLAHFRFRPEYRGRRVAVLTILCCVVVLVSVLGDPLYGTAHQAPPGAGQ